MSPEADPVYTTDKPSIVLLKKQTIPAGTNLNTYTETGLYHQSVDANATLALNYPVALSGMLETQSNGQGTFMYQKYHVYGSNNAVYIRTFYSTWSAWNKLTRDSDVILNQIAAAQDANMWIDGNIRVGAPSSTNADNNINNYLQYIGGNDFFGISGGTSGLLDRGEAVFTVGDNGKPYYDNGQRFRWNYSNSNNGTAKDVMILDYDSTKIFNDLQVTGKVTAAPATLGTELATLTQVNSAATAAANALTWQNVTSAVNANTITNAIQITGANNLSLGFKGLQMYFDGTQSVIRSLERNLNTYPLLVQGGAGTNTTANTVKITDNLYYNNAPVWYTNGILQSNSSITLGDGPNTAAYLLTLKRTIGGTAYTAANYITSFGALTGGSVLTAANATPAQTAMFGIAPNTYAPVYSRDNGATSTFLVLQDGTNPITTTNTVTAGNITTAGTVTAQTIKGGGSKPTITIGSGLTGTVTLSSTSTNTAGFITLNLTNTAGVSATLFNLSFTNSYGSIPNMVYSSGQQQRTYFGTLGAGGFGINAAESHGPGTYAFTYMVIQ